MNGNHDFLLERRLKEEAPDAIRVGMSARIKTGADANEQALDR